MAELPQIPPVILPQSSLFNLDLAGIPVAPGLHLEKKWQDLPSWADLTV
ncbi:hypothetical protein ACVW01_001735 [Thermostichus sp. MS-CIW-19]|nr:MULTISPECIES: hypothetical protein [unclassified Synechococcus]ABC99595.1 hypothetical protein CYA_1427 [Synechococcus sp. JA-3-3Ab]ABD02560.1 hypothetical protein CYB_1597 [Synechococcus sp. JA-2-3B'a(2-13)]